MRIARMALAAMVAGLAFAGTAAADGPQVGKEVGSADVPDIQVSEWINNRDGRTTLADYRGEVVLVKLWATT